MMLVLCWCFYNIDDADDNDADAGATAAAHDEEDDMVVVMMKLQMVVMTTEVLIRKQHSHQLSGCAINLADGTPLCK